MEVNCLVFYPFAYVLLDDCTNQFCWYCLKESETGENGSSHLLRCSGCKTAYFCAKECQLNGWSDHKAECKGFSRTNGIPDVEIRMLGRLTLRYKQILNGQDKKDDKFYINRTSNRNIMDLCSHDSEMRADENAWKKFQVLLKELKDFYHRKFLLDDETIFQLHCRNFINRHGISDRTYMKEIGKGLYLDLCWYDHSCRPNSVYTHNGFIAILRPLSSNVILSDRSTTFYTYIDLLQTKEERRRCLSDSWYFDCECNRCIDESDHLLTSVKCVQCQSSVTIFQDRRLKAGQDLCCKECNCELDENRLKEGIMAMQHLRSFSDEGDSAPSEDRLGKIDSLLNQYTSLLPDCNIHMVRLLRLAILSTDADDVERMLRYHLQAVDCMRLCFPVNHPTLAYHLMNIGSFYGRMKNREEAMKFLEEAKAMFQFTLGADHYLTARAEEEIEGVKMLESDQ